jgi:hypothetical protein
MKPAFKILFVVWLNLCSLGFISACFFDYNPKTVFSEIQEKQNEDDSEEDGLEIEFLKSTNWEHAQLHLNIIDLFTEKCLTHYLISQTCKGHILVPVKPPLARS